jgi:hypothetical protein
MCICVCVYEEETDRENTNICIYLHLSIYLYLFISISNIYIHIYEREQERERERERERENNEAQPAPYLFKRLLLIFSVFAINENTFMFHRNIPLCMKSQISQKVREIHDIANFDRKLYFIYGHSISHLNMSELQSSIYWVYFIQTTLLTISYTT